MMSVLSTMMVSTRSTRLCYVRIPITIHARLKRRRGGDELFFAINRSCFDARRGRKWFVLNPHDFKTMFVENGMSAGRSQRVVPAILRLIMPRKTMATLVDLKDGSEPRRIGAEIPPFRGSVNH